MAPHPQEARQLRGLADLHTLIRGDSATATSRSLWRAVAGLVPPTVVFALTVLAEVSADRLLDTTLPWPDRAQAVRRGQLADEGTHCPVGG